MTEKTGNDIEVDNIMGLSELGLLDYVISHPEYMTDGYYRMFGSAINKRHDELVELRPVPVVTTKYIEKVLDFVRGGIDDAELIAARTELAELETHKRNALVGVLPWRPINELFDKDGKYDHENDDPNGFLLMAPELVDEDCNVHGIGMGYWQDDGLTWHATQEECDAWPDDRECGAFMACKWSMTNDEWAHVCCAPTHYLRLRGAETCK